MIAPPARYSILCALVLGGLALLATQGPRLGLLPALLLLPLAAWPAWLALAYPATVRRIEARSSLQDGERPWWAPFLGGALWKQVTAVPVALCAAWSLCASLIADGVGTLAWAGAASLLSYAIAVAVARRTGPLKAYAKPRPVLLSTPVLVAVLLTAAWLLTRAPDIAAETLADAIAGQARYEGASVLLAWAMDLKGLLDGGGVWASAWADRQGGWPLGIAWRAAGTFAQFWLLGLVVAGLLLPRGAAGRILAPSDADEPLPIGRGRAAMAAFAASLLCLFALSSLAALEARAMQHRQPVAVQQQPAPSPPILGDPLPAMVPLQDPEPSRTPHGLPNPTDLRLAIEAERLGDRICPEGTYADLQRLDDAMRSVLSAQRASLESAARQGFAVMRGHVPAYLDWYYSLPAEYARTGHLLMGDAEAHLEQALREHLESGAPLAPVLAAVEAMEGNPALIEGWKGEREALLGPCRDAALPSDAGMVLPTAVAPEAILMASPAVEALDLHARLGGAGAASMAGGLVGVAVGKLVAKEAFGLAVEAVGKLALGKATGWLGGAAAGAGSGALIGSVAPVLGTTVGAAVGGALGGVAAWVATDYVLLEFEEAISRDRFEADILAAIDEAEAAFLASFRPVR